jgi:hypothetical protein
MAGGLSHYLSDRISSHSSASTLPGGFTGVPLYAILHISPLGVTLSCQHYHVLRSAMFVLQIAQMPGFQDHDSRGQRLQPARVKGREVLLPHSVSRQSSKQPFCL